LKKKRGGKRSGFETPRKKKKRGIKWKKMQKESLTPLSDFERKEENNPSAPRI